MIARRGGWVEMEFFEDERYFRMFLGDDPDSLFPTFFLYAEPFQIPPLYRYLSAYVSFSIK